jgi:DNA uptake protein ComE-like DNA-binding protein
MWKAFTQFFYMSPRDRRGVVLLLLLIGVLICLRWWQFRLDWQKGEAWRTELLASLRDSVNGFTEFKNESVSSNRKTESRAPSKSSDFQDFNPNTIDQASLVSWGLSEEVARRWTVYREKGAVFRRPEDVLKLYGIDSLWWVEAKFYMDFSEKSNAENIRFQDSMFAFDPHRLDSADARSLGFSSWQYVQLRKYLESGRVIERSEDLLQVYGLDPALYLRISPYVRLDDSPFPIDLNLADSLELLRIQQVGPFYASQIVSLRKLVGYFVDCRQLMAIRGMDSLRCAAICSQVKINDYQRVRYDINRASVAELSAIPYLSTAAAREIVSFRENFRAFISVEEVVQLSLFPRKHTYLVLPYLIVSENE